MGGHTMLARTVQESFAMVEVPGAPGVDIYSNNQHVATTNRSGVGLVPNLLPYQRNTLRIDDRGLPAPVGELGWRRSGEAALRRGGLENHQPIRLGIADGLEQNRVDDGKDRRVGADTKGQGAHGGQGEAGALEKCANGVPGVGHYI